MIRTSVIAITEIVTIIGIFNIFSITEKHLLYNYALV